MCYCWLAKCLELWIVHLLVLSEPHSSRYQQFNSISLHWGQQRFGELCSAEQGQKEEGLKGPLVGHLTSILIDPLDATTFGAVNSTHGKSSGKWMAHW